LRKLKGSEVAFLPREPAAEAAQTTDKGTPLKIDHRHGGIPGFNGSSAGPAAAVLALLLGTAVAWWQAVATRIAADNEVSQRRAAEGEKKAADVARKTAEDQRAPYCCRNLSVIFWASS
jgi:hypothetical protein